MARIVMCWELGGGLGHVAPMKPLAEALRARGHEVCFIVRETLAAELLLDPVNLPWFRAPLQVEPVIPFRRPTLNMAHILHNNGFHNSIALIGRLRAWRNLFDTLQPEILVFNHSPTALVAARGLKAKRMLVGNGFDIPPATIPLPPFNVRYASVDLQADEDKVTSCINEALATFGTEPLKKLADIYQSEACVLFTIKELDHYPGRIAGDYWGSTRQDSGVAPQWPLKTGRRVFAYLKPFKTLPSLLTTLKKSGHPILVYMNNVPADLKHQFTSESMSFSAQPVDFERTMQDSDLVICHAGHGTSSASLLAGRPLLVLPLNLEQRMVAARVVESGAGLAAPALAPDAMEKKFHRLMAEPAFSVAAMAIAERYKTLDAGKLPMRFADLAGKLLGC